MSKSSLQLPLASLGVLLVGFGSAFATWPLALAGLICLLVFLLSTRRPGNTAAETRAERLRQAVTEANEQILQIILAYFELRDPGFQINRDSALRINLGASDAARQFMIDIGTWGHDRPMTPRPALQPRLREIYRKLIAERIGEAEAEAYLCAVATIHTLPLRRLSLHEKLARHAEASELDTLTDEAIRTSPYGC